MKLFPQFRPGICEDRYRKQGSVFGSGRADGERADGDAGGHLGNREQRIEALQYFAFDRNTEHGQNRLRSTHSGQMGRATGAGDDDLDAA